MPALGRCTAASLALVAALGGEARADETPQAPENTQFVEPVSRPFIQYGVAFTTELVANAGAICNSTAAPCILGSGGGVVFPRVGWRSLGHWYIGGAYEMSKQDANTLYQLAILQQLRAEARYYLLLGHVLAPFMEGSLGVVGYGNEWTVDTYGPAASLAFGVESQISLHAVLGATLGYRLLHLSGFTDSAGTEREGGFAQLVGLNVLLEVRDPY